jgi:predicted nucleic acid-binding protein
VRARANQNRLEQQRRPVAVLTTTLAEAHTLILYRQGASAAAAWFDAITPSVRMIHPTIEDFRTAIPLIRQFPDQRLMIFEALVYVVSNRLGLPIWSYDHHFDMLQANRWYE